MLTFGMCLYCYALGRHKAATGRERWCTVADLPAEWVRTWTDGQFRNSAIIERGAWDAWKAREEA